jgi:oligopeptide/dipeptide ABC transporter ATP-binding protein
MNILEVQNLSKDYFRHSGLFNNQKKLFRAVDSVSFTIAEGESLGLVGETGCGKTTAARMIVRLINPSGGKILFNDGEKILDLADIEYREMKPLRRNIQIVFQDPFSSLSPRKRVLDIIAEPLICQGIRRNEYRDRVEELLTQVGLDPQYIDRYPHSFSGGQRQRIGIARALSVSPRLIVADEPVSALDVSVQAHILNLMLELQRKYQLTYLFISHDLGVVRYICNRIAVMYRGRIVEMGEAKSLYAAPLHPYTSALLGAVPDADPNSRWEVEAHREEDTGREEAGCSYRERCPAARNICKAETPVFRRLSGDRHAACHFAESLNLAGVGSSSK